MTMIKEFFIVITTSFTISFLLVFWDAQGSNYEAVEIGAFILCFYYLYTSGDDIFNISHGESTGEKLVTVIAVLAFAKLGSSIIVTIINNVIGL